MANVRIKDLPKNTNVTPDSYLLVEAKNPDGTYSTVKVYIADAIISSGTSVVGNVDSTITASATAANSTTRLSAANIVRGNNSTAFGYSNTVPGDNSGILGGRNNFTGVDGLGAPLSGVFILGNSISAVEPNTTYIENLDVKGAQFVHGYSYFYGPVYTLEYSSDEWNTTYATVSALSASWIGGGGSSEGYVNSNFLNLTGGIISGPVRINNDLTVFGNLTATGTTTFANTVFSVTSALSVVHIGSGPALYVGNNGDGDIASFYDIDSNVEVFHVGGNTGTHPNVGVKTSTPNVDFTVNGQISANNTIWSAGGNSNNWNSAFNTATAYQNASGSFATNTLLQTTSALLTPLTLTRTLTSQLVLNTAINSLTGNWNSTYNTVSALSATWSSGGGGVSLNNENFINDQVTQFIIYKPGFSNVTCYRETNPFANTYGPGLGTTPYQLIGEACYNRSFFYGNLDVSNQNYAVAVGWDGAKWIIRTLRQGYGTDATSTADFPWLCTYGNQITIYNQFEGTTSNSISISPTQTIGEIPSSGTSDKAARADHLHTLPYQSPNNDNQNIIITTPSNIIGALSAQKLDIIKDGYWPVRSNRKLTYGYSYALPSGNDDPETLFNYSLSWTINGSVSAWQIIFNTDNQQGFTTTAVVASSLSNTTYPWDATWIPSNTTIIREYNVVPLTHSLSGTAGVSPYISRADHTHPQPFQPNPEYFADDVSDALYNSFRYIRVSSTYYATPSDQDGDNKWIRRYDGENVWKIGRYSSGGDGNDYTDVTSLNNATYPWQAIWPSGTLVTKASATRVVGQALAVNGTEGTSRWAARADHKHPFPTAQQVGAAATSHTHFINDINGDIAILNPANSIDNNIDTISVWYNQNKVTLEKIPPSLFNSYNSGLYNSTVFNLLGEDAYKRDVWGGYDYISQIGTVSVVIGWNGTKWIMRSTNPSFSAESATAAVWPWYTPFINRDGETFNVYNNDNSHFNQGNSGPSMSPTLTIGEIYSTGTSVSAARADHQHPLPYQAPSNDNHNIIVNIPSFISLSAQKLTIVKSGIWPVRSNRRLQYSYSFTTPGGEEEPSILNNYNLSWTYTGSVSAWKIIYNTDNQQGATTTTVVASSINDTAYPWEASWVRSGTSLPANTITSEYNLTPLALTLSGTAGTSPYISRADHTHPAQLLSLSGNNLSITNGNIVSLSSFATRPYVETYEDLRNYNILIESLRPVRSALPIGTSAIDNVTLEYTDQGLSGFKGPWTTVIGNNNQGNPINLNIRWSSPPEPGWPGIPELWVMFTDEDYDGEGGINTVYTFLAYNETTPQDNGPFNINDWYSGLDGGGDPITPIPDFGTVPSLKGDGRGATTRGSSGVSDFVSRVDHTHPLPVIELTDLDGVPNTTFRTLSSEFFLPKCSYLINNGSTIGTTKQNYGFSSFTLTANGVYELSYDVWYLKNTASTVTYTLTSNNPPIFPGGLAIIYNPPRVSGEVLQTINTGVSAYSAPTKSYFPQTTGIWSGLNTDIAFPETASLSNDISHHAAIRYFIRAGAVGNIVSLAVTAAAGTITPLSNSYAKLTRLA